MAHPVLCDPPGGQRHLMPKAFSWNDPPPPRCRCSRFLPSHLFPDVSFPKESRSRHRLCHLVWSGHCSRRNHRHTLFRRILPLAESSRALLYRRRSYPPPPDLQLTAQRRHGPVQASLFKSFRISDLLHHPTQAEYIRASSVSYPKRPHKSLPLDAFSENNSGLQAPPPNT